MEALTFEQSCDMVTPYRSITFPVPFAGARRAQSPRLSILRS